jgi:hypothetical protein
MTDNPETPTPSDTVIIVVQKYPMGGFGFAVSTDGSSPGNGAMAASTFLHEGLQRIAFRALEDKFREPVLPPPVVQQPYTRQQESYAPTGEPPPRARLPEGQTIEDMPSVIARHPGVVSGLMEKMRNGGNHVSGWVVAALVSGVLLGQRMGLA